MWISSLLYDLDDVDVGDVSEHLEAEDLDTKDTEEDKEVTQVKMILFICHTLQLMWKMKNSEIFHLWSDLLFPLCSQLNKSPLSGPSFVNCD